jgi:hypothetical protein
MKTKRCRLPDGKPVAVENETRTSRVAFAEPSKKPAFETAFVAVYESTERTQVT